MSSLRPISAHFGAPIWGAPKRLLISNVVFVSLFLCLQQADTNWASAWFTSLRRVNPQSPVSVRGAHSNWGAWFSSVSTVHAESGKKYTLAAGAVVLVWEFYDRMV